MTVRVSSHRPSAVHAAATSATRFLAEAKFELNRLMTSERTRYPSSEQFWDSKSVDKLPSGSAAAKLYDFLQSRSGGDGVESWEIKVHGKPALVVRGDANLASDENKNVTMVGIFDRKTGKALDYGYGTSSWAEGKSFTQNAKSLKWTWAQSHVSPEKWTKWPEVDPS